MPTKRGWCKVCMESRVIVGRGLCHTCYSKPPLRQRHTRKVDWHRWTHTECNTLRLLIRAGWTWWRIGCYMSIGCSAVRAKARALGYMSQYQHRRDARGLFT